MPDRLLLVLIGLLVAGAVLTSCSEPANDTETKVADAQGDRRGIEAVVSHYYDAATAKEVCEVITAGFEAFIDEQSEPPINPAAPAGDACVTAIKAAVKRGDFVLEPQDITVGEVIVESHRSALLVHNSAVSKTPYPVFVVETDAGWLVTGENAFTPPGFEDLRTEALAR